LSIAEVYTQSEMILKNNKKNETKIVNKPKIKIPPVYYREGSVEERFYIFFFVMDLFVF